MSPSMDFPVLEGAYLVDEGSLVRLFWQPAASAKMPTDGATVRRRNDTVVAPPRLRLRGDSDGGRGDQITVGILRRMLRGNKPNDHRERSSLQGFAYPVCQCGAGSENVIQAPDGSAPPLPLEAARACRRGTNKVSICPWHECNNEEAAGCR